MTLWTNSERSSENTSQSGESGRGQKGREGGVKKEARDRGIWSSAVVVGGAVGGA